MISVESFTAEHIRSVQQQSKGDPALIERAIYAFGLLEAIARSELPFIFKGGTALMLLLDKPRRFSTDIDIVVAPGIRVDEYLRTAASIRPFIRMAEQVRNTAAGIEKRHFKFSYNSPLTGREQTMLLDILFEKDPYSATIERTIENKFLVTEHPAVYVRLPDANCIVADKLTAFAPHTTGIQLNVDKEMEIIKQLYDISVLIGHIDDFAEVKSNYRSIVATELKYRGIDSQPEDALHDMIETATCIAGRGQHKPDEYLLLKKGISNIRNHIIGESFNGEVAASRACMVMYLAAAILTDQSDLPALMDDSYYINADIKTDKFKKLSHIKKRDLSAYKYLFEAAEMLSR